MSKPTLKGIERAASLLKGVVDLSPLQKSEFLSELYEADIWLKREDLQTIRSYKLRGAYNFIFNANQSQKEKGVACASAGNHAQGFAFSCHKLGIKGTIFMPATTPKQKVKQVKYIGKESIEVILHGDTYDDAKEHAKSFCKDHDVLFVSPFDHPLTIEGQGTVAKEIIEQCGQQLPDYVFMPVGGGGLSSGCSIYFKNKSPDTKLIGVEPVGAPAMYESLKQGKIVRLEHIDNFVDGAAVKEESNKSPVTGTISLLILRIKFTVLA